MMNPTPKQPRRSEPKSNMIVLPSQSELDLTSPASTESEMALLGAVLVNPTAYAEASRFLEAGDFFLLKHQQIWAATGELDARGEPIDVLTVAEQLSAMKQLEPIGGMAYLTHLLNSTPSSVHGMFYAQMVVRASMRRLLMQAADAMKALARDESIALEQILERSDDLYTPIRARANQQLGLGMSEGMQLALDVVERGASGLANGLHIPTGNDIGLDDLLGGGWERGKYWVVFARSEHGKTAFMMNAAIQAAKAGASVAFFSTEIPRVDVMTDFLALEAGLHSQRLRTGALSQDDHSAIIAAAERLSGLRLTVFEAQEITCKGMYDLCRVAKQSEGLDMVCVDYIQKVAIPDSAPFRGNTYAELSYVTRQLERMCRPNRLDVAMLAASQVNRVVDSQKDKRPHKSQVEGSNVIEQTADGMVGLARHGALEKDSQTPTHFEMDVQKNRQTGRHGMVLRRLNPTTRRIERIDKPY